MKKPHHQLKRVEISSKADESLSALSYRHVLKNNEGEFNWNDVEIDAFISALQKVDHKNLCSKWRGKVLKQEQENFLITI